MLVIGRARARSSGTSAGRQLLCDSFDGSLRRARHEEARRMLFCLIG